MPITVNILENKVLGREFKRGYAVGFRRGYLRAIRPHIEKRFGPIPPWEEGRLSNLSMDELEAFLDRLFDAPTIQNPLP